MSERGELLLVEFDASERIFEIRAEERTLGTQIADFHSRTLRHTPQLLVLVRELFRSRAHLLLEPTQLGVASLRRLVQLGNELKIRLFAICQLKLQVT